MNGTEKTPTSHPPTAQAPPPDISMTEAAAKFVAKEVFDHEFSLLKQQMADQKALSIQTIVGVVVAFIFTIGVIGVEVILFHARNNSSDATTDRYETGLRDLHLRVLQERVDADRKIDAIESRIDSIVQQAGK